MKPFAEQMPEYLAKGTETVAIWRAMEDELERLWATREDYFVQLSLNTATWSLRLWERAYGLEPDEGQPPEYRRERIKARMRGQGTATAAMIKNMAESFTNGQVDVEEQPGEYRLLLRFVGSAGVPPNIGDVAEAVEEIKPAHLAFAFAYTYTTHDELRAHTHDALSLMIHSQIRRPDEHDELRAYLHGKLADMMHNQIRRPDEHAK